MVGWTVLPLRFDLSQALCVCWCDSCVIQDSFVVFLHILEV